MNKIKIRRSKLSVAEKGRLENAEVAIEMNGDSDSYSQQVVQKIREKEISPSVEFAIHRKAIKAILDKLGITDEEFETYNTLVENAKKDAKRDEVVSQNSK